LNDAGLIEWGSIQYKDDPDGEGWRLTDKGRERLP
jgi:hypothetical protein